MSDQGSAGGAAGGAASGASSGGAGTALMSGGGASSSAAAPASGGQAASPASSGDWMSGFNDDMKGYVQNKGFKDPLAVLESYRNYEKAIGTPQDRLLKLPENMDSPEGRAIFERLGTPKEAKDYKIEIPKEHGDPKLAEEMREIAHKFNFTNKQMEGLVEWWNGRSANNIKAMGEQQKTNLNNANQNLRKTWGAAFEQNMNLADQGAMALGMGEKEVKALGAALGPDKAMMFLHKLAISTGEAKFVTGGSTSNGIMTPDQAKSKIKELTKDSSFYKRLMSRDADATKQWENLHKAATPRQMSR